MTSPLKGRASAGEPSFNALPATNSIQGASSVAVWKVDLKALGLLAANDTDHQRWLVGFAIDINPNLIVGVALHEINHAMGRVPYGPTPGIFDLFRFKALGVCLFEADGPASRSSYLSADKGVTSGGKLCDGLPGDQPVGGWNFAYAKFLVPLRPRPRRIRSLAQARRTGLSSWPSSTSPLTEKVFRPYHRLQRCPG